MICGTIFGQLSNRSNFSCLKLFAKNITEDIFLIFNSITYQTWGGWGDIQHGICMKPHIFVFTLVQLISFLQEITPEIIIFTLFSPKWDSRKPFIHVWFTTLTSRNSASRLYSASLNAETKNLLSQSHKLKPAVVVTERLTWAGMN